MTTTDTTISKRLSSPKSHSARSLSSHMMTAQLAVVAFVVVTAAKVADGASRFRKDERGAISVEQFAWIGLGLLLVAGAAAALAVYWGDVSTWITNEWTSITSGNASG
jgi:Flp pilus assembly pilin Flp